MSWYWYYQPTQATWVPHMYPPAAAEQPPLGYPKGPRLPAPFLQQWSSHQYPAQANVWPNPQPQYTPPVYPQAPAPAYQPAWPNYAQQPHPYYPMQYPAHNIQKPPKSKSPPKTFRYVPPGQHPDANAVGKNVWHGRTREQVNADNHIMGLRSGYKGHAMAPRDPKDDQTFMVVELDRSYTRRTARTIGEMRGHWERDPSGQMYFIRGNNDADSSASDSD
ncbi:MAG: hypothetical protein M1828_005733 [Chrysothrix sp. TS-e1954]|nr:MAG: hypothetical protein M1828_005733 [Chrysothrix sp. TS-e1954]